MKNSFNSTLALISVAILAVSTVCAEAQRKTPKPPSSVTPISPMNEANASGANASSAVKVSGLPTNSTTKHHLPSRNEANASELDELQRDMAPITGIESEFTQLKKLSIFSKTLKITGRMKIRMPRYFKWEVLTPLKSTVVADGDTVAIWDEETNETVTMSLKDNPVAGGIWTQIDSFFMGRYDKLKKMYDMKLIAQSPLTLCFTPRSKPLSTVMKNVTLTFAKDKRGRYLSRVLMRENGGDSTTIDFKNVKLHRTAK